MYYKLINNRTIKVQPKSLTHGDITYINNIPIEVLLENEYYPLVEVCKPDITDYQLLDITYYFEDNQIKQRCIKTYKSLSECQALKLDEIIEYDKSESVNLFYYNDVPMWFDKASRTSLAYLASCNKIVGKTEVPIRYEDLVFNLNIDNALGLLARLEVYAGECYNVTENHKQEIKKLNNIEDVIDYDITADYPEKLTF